MCQFFSGLITKNKTYFNLDHDDHQRLIMDAKLRDDGYDPNFVRVELLPQDKDIFNHNMKNWKLKVDQDFRPDWFEEKWAEAEMKKEIKNVFKNRFVFNRNLDKIENGRWFIGAGGTVQYVMAGGTVQDVMAGGTVQDVRDGGAVQDVRDGGAVQDVRGVCIFRSNNPEYKKIADNGIVILKNDKKILVAHKDFKLVKVENK